MVSLYRKQTVRSASASPQRQQLDQLKQILKDMGDQEPEASKKILKDFLMRQAEKMINETRIAQRQNLLQRVRKNCALSKPIEEKESYVDRKIEKDLRWFLPSSQQEAHNSLNMMIKQSKQNEKKTMRDKNNQSVQSIARHTGQRNSPAGFFMEGKKQFKNR